MPPLEFAALGRCPVCPALPPLVVGMKLNFTSRTNPRYINSVTQVGVYNMKSKSHHLGYQVIMPNFVEGFGYGHKYHSRGLLLLKSCINQFRGVGACDPPIHSALAIFQMDNVRPHVVHNV
ncbi:hypothetical protein TNCV_3859951 [Trichonephila clavipes]|nr:hypothetical protein TNCV_3859951 [Trichonephila clavipes]